MRGTLELIITEHALDRLNDFDRFSECPHLAVKDEIRIHHLRRVHTKEEVWMCQLKSGFLVGNLKTAKRRQVFVAMTAFGKDMFRKTSYVRIACHRRVVDGITAVKGRQYKAVSTLKECAAFQLEASSTNKAIRKASSSGQQ